MLRTLCSRDISLLGTGQSSFPQLQRVFDIWNSQLLSVLPSSISTPCHLALHPPTSPPAPLRPPSFTPLPTADLCHPGPCPAGDSCGEEVAVKCGCKRVKRKIPCTQVQVGVSRGELGRAICCRD